MARSRNIKPGFYKNEDLAECSIWARFIFPGLWQISDRNGLLEDRPKRIKGELLPYDSVDVEPLLVELHDRAFIFRFVDPEGRRLICIPSFSTHQSPHYSEKPGPFKLPALPDKWRHKASKNLGDTPEEPESAPDNSRSDASIKRGSQPPDSLIPDSTTPPPPPAGGVAVDNPVRQPPSSPKAKRPTGQWWRSPEGVAAMGRHLGIEARMGEQTGEYAARLREIDAARKAEAKGARTPKASTQGSTPAAAVPPLTHAREPEPEPEPELDPPPASAFAQADVIDGEFAEIDEQRAIEDDPQWWEKPDRVMARAVELQVQVFDGESFDNLVARVLAAFGPGPHTESLDPELQQRVQYFAAVGVNSDSARPQAN